MTEKKKPEKDEEPQSRFEMVPIFGDVEPITEKDLRLLKKYE